MGPFRILRWNQFHWAALLLCSVVAVRPLTVYLNSIREFSVSLYQVAEFSGQYFIIIFPVFFVFGLLLNLGRFKEKGKLLAAVTLAASIMLWVQANFLLWNYGILDGKSLDFNAYTYHGMLEVALWLSIIAFAAFKYKSVAAWAKKISMVIIATLILSVVFAYSPKPLEIWHKNAKVSTDNYFTYSNKQNVIVIAIDAARGDVFQEILNEMSEAEKAVWDGFTFFRNSTGTFNMTNLAVPGILTGRLYDHKTPENIAYPDMFLSQSSILYRLKQEGFVTEVYPYAANSVFLSPENVDNLKLIKTLSPEEKLVLYQKDLDKIGLVTGFNFAPHFAKRWLFDSASMYVTAVPGAVEPPAAPKVAAATPQKIEGGDAKKEPRAGLPKNIIEHINYNRWIINELGTHLVYIDRPVFKYLHFHGAHPPFFHDENYEGKRLPLSMDSYKRQFKGSLLLTIKALVESLKRQGVYDQTMLVVVGDHGLHVPSARASESMGLDRRIVDSLVPLLMVKPFGASAEPVKISAAPVSLFDVPATVFDALGINVDDTGRSIFSVQKHSGRPVFSVQERENRLRHAYSFARTGTSNIGAYEFEIDGDAHDPASWKPTYRFLSPNKGAEEMDLTDYQSRERELAVYLGEVGRFRIND